MPKSKRSTARSFVDADEIPDMSTPHWRKKFEAAVVVKRGRPKSERPKVSTTIRLDADVLEHFRASGDGWQTRMNAALRSSIKKSRRAA